MWGQDADDDDIRAVVRELVGLARDAIEDYLNDWYEQEGIADSAARAHRSAGLALALVHGAVVQTALLGGSCNSGWKRGSVGCFGS